MGSVYLAQQTEPVKRAVAVKVIKAGMDSKAVLARFEAERQALAMMDHPNIAKVLDAGATDAGRPFFVMELVKGKPITQFCDERKLTPRQRLELFVPVCQAVQHAHQKGVIHRDIKPTNVLVALYDDRPVPKVIDFGVAKAAGQSLTDRTLMTGFGAVVGTPEYMSPEQASLNNLDIDTRSDVYALGVLLYELLTGSTPVDRKSLGKAALLEVLRIVREVEAPRPSAKLSTLDTLPSVAANRGTEPAKLSRLMKGELDWVVLKALEKDRTRRYDTANGLARDIQRYLADEVVEARPPSTGYRVRTFVRRHKGQVVAAGLVLFALVAGIAGTTAGLFEAKRQERIALAAAEEERQAKRQAEDEKANALKAAAAEQAAKLDADARRQEAERNLAFAKKGNDILGSVFAGLDPAANYPTVAELRNALRDNLTGAVKELDGSAIGDPLEVAAMQNTLGMSLLGLGDANLAIDVLGKPLATRKVRLGADDPATLTSMNNLALGYLAAGETGRAVPLFAEALKRRTEKLGIDHPDTLTSMNNLAVGHQSAGETGRAVPLFAEALKRRRATLGAEHPDTLLSMNNLALGHKVAGELDRAVPLLEEALTLRRTKFGADHPDTFESMTNLAAGYLTVGVPDRAVPLLEEAIKLRRARVGADHPDTLASMNNLAEGYLAAGEAGRAVTLFADTLKLRTARLGADHPDTLTTMNNLALGYLAAGEAGRAVTLFAEVLKVRSDKLGGDHPHTLLAMNNLAEGYRTVGKIDQALPLFGTAAAGMEKRRFRHEHAKLIVRNTIAAYEEALQFDKAEEWRRKWLAAVKAEAGAASPAYAGELAALGMPLLTQRKWAEAEPLLRECLAVREKVQPDAWTTFNTKSMLGGTLLGQGKYAEAGPLLVAGYEGLKQRERTIPPPGGTRIPEALDRLVDLSAATNRPDDLRKWRAERAAYPFVAPPPREKR